LCSWFVDNRQRVSEGQSIDEGVHRDETKHPPARRMFLEREKGFFYSFNT